VRFRVRGLWAWSALLLVALVLAPPAARGQEAGGGVAVSYPTDRTYVLKSYLSVEGFVRDPAIEEVQIVVNGGRPQRAAVRDLTFAEEVSLDDGLNTVRVGSLEVRVWLVAAASPAPAGYHPVYGHFGLDGGCRECHTIDAAGAFSLAGERDEICRWCHADLTRGVRGVPWASVHAPVRDGRCLLCHSPHLSEKKGLPAAGAPGCASCHGSVTDRLKTDRFVHGPMNLGDCRLCHTVHASTAPKLLVRPATALCTDCHSDALAPAGGDAAVRPHPMIPEGQCGRCHEPHSSENLRLLRQPAGRLCQGCHEGKTRSFHEAKGFSIYVCAKCHDLHRPTQPHLIMDASRSLCTECHDFRGESVFTHSFVAAGKCFLCHSFHEASLAQDVAALCLGCHRDNPRLAQAHRGVAIERSRCTSCHLPHLAQRGKLLRAQEHTPFKERACERCHRDRADKIGPVLRPLCADCHRDKAAAAAGAASVHPPFRDGDCGSCHRSHNSEQPNLLTEAQGPLCLGCHRKMRKAVLIAPVSGHTAVLAGRCGSCHDPHYAANAALLRQPPDELCVSCHGALVRQPGGTPWAVGHKPVEQGKCRLCHRSHTAANEKLLKAPSPQSCRPCHSRFFEALEPPGAVSIHKPVKEGACASCHTLHGGALAGLLKEGARTTVCRGCHPTLAGSHHVLTAEELTARGGGVPAAARGCVLCHRPHASAQRRLLPPGNDAVCRGCHTF
jgi:predicted CXXCH cytochrome family protein